MIALQEVLGTRDEVRKMAKERWGVDCTAELPDGSKYGSPDDSQKVFNQILGIVTVGELKEAEKFGAVVYQFGHWKIPTEPSVTVINSVPTVKASYRYNEWKMRQKNHPSVNRAADILGGVVIDHVPFE